METIKNYKRALLVTVLAACFCAGVFGAPEIVVREQLPIVYMMESYVWLNNREIVYTINGQNPSYLRLFNVETHEDTLLLDGEHPERSFYLYTGYPVYGEGKWMFLSVCAGGSHVLKPHVLHVETRELFSIELDKPFNEGLEMDEYGYMVGHFEEGPVYFRHLISEGIFERYPCAWEESGYYDGYGMTAMLQVSDVMGDRVLVTYYPKQLGNYGVINYITRFNGNGFDPVRAVVMDGDEPNRRVNYGACFLGDGNILYGQYLGSDSVPDPDEIYCKLRICDGEGNLLYTLEDFEYMYDMGFRSSMSPDRRFIIISGYDLTKSRLDDVPYLLEIVYDEGT